MFHSNTLSFLCKVQMHTNIQNCLSWTTNKNTHFLSGWIQCQFHASTPIQKASGIARNLQGMFSQISKAKLVFHFQSSHNEKGESRKRERHQYMVASCMPPTGDLVHNPGMCPDWESNQRPFGSQAGTQSTEPHQQGPISSTLCPEIFTLVS